MRLAANRCTKTQNVAEHAKKKWQVWEKGMFKEVTTMSCLGTISSSWEPYPIYMGDFFGHHLMGENQFF